jgi:hypothetical protein
MISELILNGNSPNGVVRQDRREKTKNEACEFGIVSKDIIFV